MSLTWASGEMQPGAAPLVAVSKTTMCGSPGTTRGQPMTMSSVVMCGQMRGAAKRRPAKLYQPQDVGTRGVGVLDRTTADGDQVRVWSTRRAKGPLAWTCTSSEGT